MSAVISRSDKKPPLRGDKRIAPDFEAESMGIRRIETYRKK
jgi:hypothetical protein